MLIHQNRVAVRVHDGEASWPGGVLVGLGGDGEALSLERLLQLAHIGERVERLRVLCSPGINFCEEYGRSAFLDFPDDADIVAILEA